MHKFKVNDIVKIVRQPANQCVHLTGEIAFVTDIEGDFASIQAMTLVDGSIEMSGFGTVDVGCLEHVDDEIWQRRKQEYDEKIPK